ncbi:MAG: hypothetical protein Q9226_002677 [Calogaya cf. arnoldii]
MLTSLEPQPSRATFTSAINYINRVKLRFNNQPNVFDRFLTFLTTTAINQSKFNFHRQTKLTLPRSSIDNSRTTERISDLFAGNEELLQEFFTCVSQPEDHIAATLQPMAAPTNPAVFDAAVRFLLRLKARYGGTSETYSRFLTLMNAYWNKTLDQPALIAEMSELLSNDPDMLQEFKTCTPLGGAIDRPIDLDPVVKNEIKTEEWRRLDRGTYPKKTYWDVVNTVD